MFMSGYRCIACGETQAAEFSGFVCPDCGGNLDITYDYDAVAEHIDGGFPAHTGDLFRFSALLPLEHPRPAFPLKVGGTPLYHAGRLGQSIGLSNLYLKDDTLNPSASLKDRASVVAVGRAIDIGAKVVSIASTGNAGSSLACLAAATGMSAVVFVPAAAPPAKLTQMMAFGARVLAVEGNYDDAYDLCLEASAEFGWFNRSTGYNAFTREGKKTCSFEIWQGLGREVPDRVLVPTGDGNIISAVWKGWRDLHALGLIDRLPRIDCVQSANSPAISQAVLGLRDAGSPEIDWSTLQIKPVSAATVADSIAVDQPRDGLAAVRAVIESGGEAVTVTDKDIIEAIPEMARFSGVFPEPAAAAPWAALKHMVRDGQIGADERVVLLVTGNGLKDIVGAARAVGEPRRVEASLDAVRASLE
jgi:threonine synthase